MAMEYNPQRYRIYHFFPLIPIASEVPARFESCHFPIDPAMTGGWKTFLS